MSIRKPRISHGAFDYDQYQANYRRNNPDRVAFWRFTSNLNSCIKYACEHPEAAEIFIERVQSANLTGGVI